MDEQAEADRSSAPELHGAPAIGAGARVFEQPGAPCCADTAADSSGERLVRETTA